MKQNQNQDHCIGGKKKIILSDNIDNIDNNSYNFFFLRKDFDGNLCVYTPASAINNRGLFPCQVRIEF